MTFPYKTKARLLFIAPDTITGLSVEILFLFFNENCCGYSSEVPLQLYFSNMNIGTAYRWARNKLCFEKPHFAVIVRLDNSKAKKSSKKSKYKVQAITLKTLVPDLSSWSRQIQIDLPHYIIENPTNCKQNVYLWFGLMFAVPQSLLVQAFSLRHMWMAVSSLLTSFALFRHTWPDIVDIEQGLHCLHCLSVCQHLES